MIKKSSSSRLLSPLIAFLAYALVCKAFSRETPNIPPLNSYVLAAVKSMPSGKGYEASQKAVDRLAASVSVKEGRFHENLDQAGASFCSGATYIVFLRTLDLLQDRGQLTLSNKTLERYAQMGVKDGEEIFGRWNANGPGTAKLFEELKCGMNFASYEKARPGDFMKIWWTDEIGGKERGHLVVFLEDKGDSVRYWSANMPKGYSEDTVRKSKIKRVLFSRLTRHNRLNDATRLSTKNKLLADMLTKPFTWKQVVKECRVEE
ncbi:MAG: hypothetical protein ACON4R_08690 [Akkermansiaceae bacterium]